MNEDKIFRINIVTPDGLIYDHHTTMVVVKAIGGEMGVEAHHEPILVSLTIAPVKIYRVDGQIQYVAVNGGFLEMDDNVATIVANTAERPGNIDVDRAQSAEERAKEKIEKAKREHDEAELRRAAVALKRAINRIDTVSLRNR
ncbi:F0F1 ATP synthase subunit epsilon [Xylocopilactobacillus apicola]|uniref:ATP synthase epsilon chain n=1 Tax=Xylocopilactobacillus apicola TaxID=2932184 RepID=A0AAU9DIN5_9LACO|nr:F0F1 ATP synthase subunit epsilon [Xylocopilactobacillus apicola]BDR58276.1 ATP synthase epsilon chain [Xylocopilactobacillus apicola]